MHIYAIIKTGGREYRVSPGKMLKIERMEAEPGETIEFDEVCKLVNGDQVATGQPLVEGARVRAQVVKHGHEKGIMVFRMKRRRIYQDKFDRQREFTSLKINEIIFGDDVFGKHQADPRKIKKAMAAQASEAKKAATLPMPKPRSEIPPPPAIETDRPEEHKPAPRPVVQKWDAPKPKVVVTPAPRPEPLPIQEPEPAAPQSHQVQPDAQDNRKMIAAAIVALLILLALIAFFWGKEPSPQIEAKPPSADIRLQQIGQVDRPSAPAQPPE